MSDPITLSLAGGVAHLRFDRPERMNALDTETAQAFATAVAQVLADPTARVLVMSGAGRNFMAGGDVKGFHDAEDRPALIAATIDPLHGALKALEASDLITIAAAHGRVAGAGVSLVAGADLALAAEDASFALAYCRIAGVPDCGGSWALPRLVGLKRAMAMALLNEPMPAAEAEAVGLVTRCVPAAALKAEALAMAARIAQGPRAAQGRTKRLLRAAFETALPDQLDAERGAFMACAALPDFAEGVAAFLDRRTPRFED